MCGGEHDIDDLDDLENQRVRCCAYNHRICGGGQRGKFISLTILLEALRVELCVMASQSVVNSVPLLLDWYSITSM